jgi:hypothetical protein
MKLYTFKKTSWHVRFFKWIFDVNPTHRYKTMCPYFWTYALILLFLPIILVVKLFGKSGTVFLNWVKDYKNNKERAELAHLIKLCENPDLSPEDAYKIRKSKCFKKHDYWDLDFSMSDRIKQLSNQHVEYILRLKYKREREIYEKREAMVAKYEEIKEYKWFPYVSYIITFGLLGIVALAIIYGGYRGAIAIDWTWLGKWTITVLIVLATIGSSILILYGFIKYVCIPFVNWVTCIKLPNCGMCKNAKRILGVLKYAWMPIRYILMGIVKFFAIIGDMIYSTYKKKCPIITWED